MSLERVHDSEKARALPHQFEQAIEPIWTDQDACKFG